jgi:DNA-directed RNA polymerase subunit RPC12/RpoP
VTAPYTKCPSDKCNNTSFEFASLQVSGSGNSYQAIRCSHCGILIAVKEERYLSGILVAIAQKLGIGI